MKITVHGMVASGKTTVLQVIAEALHCAGFTDVVIDTPDCDGPWPSQKITDRLAALHGTDKVRPDRPVLDTHIVLTETNASRSGCANE